MPQPKSKQYVVMADANSRRFSPQTPERVFLYVENTGANPVNLRISDNVRQDGGNIVLAPGSWRQWDNSDTTPREALNVQSELGSTVAVIEGLAS